MNKRLKDRTLSNEDFAKTYRNISSRIKRIQAHNKKQREKQKAAKDAGGYYKPNIISGFGAARAKENLDMMKSESGRMEYARSSDVRKARMSDMITDMNEWSTLDYSGAKAHAETLDVNISPNWRDYSDDELSAIIRSVRDDYLKYISDNAIEWDSDQLASLITNAIDEIDYDNTIFEDVMSTDPRGVTRHYKEAKLSFKDLVDSADNDQSDTYNFIDSKHAPAKDTGAERKKKRQDELQKRLEAEGRTHGDIAGSLYDKL